MITSNEFAEWDVGLLGKPNSDLGNTIKTQDNAKEISRRIWNEHSRYAIIIQSAVKGHLSRTKVWNTNDNSKYWTSLFK
jgi:hypothetical protein